MENNISFLVEHSYIDDDKCIISHLNSSRSGHSLNLKIIQSESTKNHGLVKFVEINNQKVLDYKLIIYIDEKNFSNYKIMFLMGLIWGLELSFDNDLSISDFINIEEECKIPISSYSFSYQSTRKSLRDISIDLGGLKTQIPKLQSEVKNLQNTFYIMSGVIVFLFFLK
jgi:hypothetical protein